METLHTWWATELYPMRERDQFGVSGEFEVALAADAQATIAALQAEVHGLKRDAGLDCGDHSCLYAVTKTGMRTNGGCRCKPKRLQAELERVRALIKALPKVEGDWTVSCALAVTVVTGGIVRDISEVVAAIVQHRQGMEG